jgi:hypothetical protein
VISFRPNTSSDLIAVADEFTDIMKIIGIGRKKGDKGLSMPEMPAKEVNPEFGFRTASRDVAAAALAAIRDGGDGAPDRRRGGGRGRGGASRATTASVTAAAVSPATEPVEPMTSLEAHAEPAADASETDGRRRRRRRGGRGRGRGRRNGAESSIDESSADTGEITWEEVDDLSQLGELTDLGEPGDEREYAFSEADPATLAELGLTPDEVPAAPAPESAVVEERPARGRSRTGGRRRGTSPSGDASGEGAGSDEAVAPKAPARRGRGRATAESSGDMGGEVAAEAPTGRGRGRSRSSATRSSASRSGAAGGDAAAQGDGPSEAPAPRRRTRSTKAQAADSAAAQGSSDQGGDGSEAAGDEQGIWQRFRSGRRPARGRTT